MGIKTNPPFTALWGYISPTFLCKFSALSSPGEWSVGQAGALRTASQTTTFFLHDPKIQAKWIQSASWSSPEAGLTSFLCSLLMSSSRILSEWDQTSQSHLSSRIKAIVRESLLFRKLGSIIPARKKWLSFPPRKSQSPCLIFICSKSLSVYYWLWTLTLLKAKSLNGRNHIK